MKFYVATEPLVGEQIAKHCTRCHRDLPIKDFHSDKHNKDGKAHYCKPCKNQYSREWVQKQRRDNLEKHRVWYAEAQRRYRRKPWGMYQQLKFNAKNRGIKFVLTKDEFVEWLLEQPQHCYYCQHPFDGRRGNDFGALTVDRRNATMPYELGNLVLACRRCNTVKGYWFTEGEMLEIAERYLLGKEIK